MNADSELAEALATSQVLRPTTRSFRGEQSPFFLRLNRAANVLDAATALVPSVVP